LRSKTFYGDEAPAVQKRFLDYFLRDIDNGVIQEQRVRLEDVRARRRSVGMASAALRRGSRNAPKSSCSTCR
jgi:hypothetical protein